MKIIGEKFDIEENILKLVGKSTPITDSELTFKYFTEVADWMRVSGKINNTEFSINYSSLVFDTSIFIQFFAELINLKNEIAIFLDNEGSYPLLYAKKTAKDTIRFIFAHDYILYKNDEEYEDCLSYKVEFDILISKKKLLGEFYTILYQFLKNYDLNYANFLGFKLNKANKYLDKIKAYVDKNLSLEEKKIIKERIDEYFKMGLSDYVKELIKPENLIEPFDSTEEMMKKLCDEDEDED